MRNSKEFLLGHFCVDRDYEFERGVWCGTKLAAKTLQRNGYTLRIERDWGVCNSNRRTAWIFATPPA